MNAGREDGVDQRGMRLVLACVEKKRGVGSKPHVFRWRDI